MKRWLCALLLLFVSVWCRAGGITLNGVVVTGVVAGASNPVGLGEPLAGVDVAVEGTPFTARTDVNGYFAISDLPDGIYTLVCRKSGFPDRRQSVQVAFAGFASRCQVSMNADRACVVGNHAFGSGDLVAAYSKRYRTENKTDEHSWELIAQKAIYVGVRPETLWMRERPDIPGLPRGLGTEGMMNAVSGLENCLMAFSPRRASRSDFAEVSGAPRWVCFDRSGDTLYVALEGGRVEVRNARDGLELLRTLPFGGAVGQLSLDASGRYVVVPHIGKAAGVTLIETSRRLPAGEIATANSPQAARLVGPRLFVVSGNAQGGAVSAYDAASGRLLLSSPTDAQPTALESSPDGSRLFVACSGAARVLEFDALELKRRGSWNTAIQPQQLAVSPDGTRCFVACKQSDQVSLLDLSRPGAVGRNVKVGREPVGILFSRDGRRCFVACQADGCVMTLDGADGSLLHTTIPMPRAVPTGLAILP